ncbi:MAG TPA: hypothetical protein PKB14_02850 [Rubrivivax sp.]|nr:hypothetical protein [Rubrivivax sp.]
MMTTAAPLPTLVRAAAAGVLPPRVLPPPQPRHGVLARPVLHTRVPQQLCLDLQPRGR